MRGTPWETPTASSQVVAMSVEELRLLNQIPTEISHETSDGAATSTFGKANNVVYFTRGAVCCWASLHRPIIGEAVPPFYPSTSYSRASELHSDFDGLQCAELSLPTEYFIGGDMIYLHFEAQDQGPPVHISPQSLAAIGDQAP